MVTAESSRKRNKLKQKKTLIKDYCISRLLSRAAWVVSDDSNSSDNLSLKSSTSLCKLFM